MKFKSWEHLTNFLIIITILGVPVTWLIQTVYAARFRLWIKTIFLPGMRKALIKVYEIIENLNPEQKEILNVLATNLVKKSGDEVLKILKVKASISEDDAKKIVAAGSKKVRDLLKIEKK